MTNRPPTADEQALLHALLAAEFPGCDHLREQAVSVAVTPLDDNGSLRLIPVASTPAPVVKRVPVEAERQDTDDTTVHYLLHVVDGRLHELEVYRDDSGDVLSPTNVEELEVVVLGA